MPRKSVAKEKNPARIKMLQAAEQVFAEKGYDGARVDDIANRAGVNKVHLYYYFESKEEILKELIKAHIQEATDLIEKPFGDATSFNRETFAAMVAATFEYLNKRSDIFRILTVESLKTASANHSIFEILAPLHQKVREAIPNIGLKPEDENIQSLVEYFFFDMSPLLLFFTLHHKFAEYYHLDPAELEQVFRELYQKKMSKYSESIARKLKEQAPQER